MTPEQRLDRLEKIVKAVVKEGLRERREMRDRINALISAQMRDEEAVTQYKVRTEEAMAHLAHAQANTQKALGQFMRRTDETMAQLAGRTDEGMAHLAHAQANTEEKLSAFITNTDEKLSALINTVDRIANERGNGKA